MFAERSCAYSATDGLPPAEAKSRGTAAVRTVPQLTRVLRHAKEAALKHDLRVMRELIQQYKVDKKKYPESIKGLVEENYLREIPADPITGNHDSWLEVHHECTDPDDPNCDPGVVDVKSGAPGNDVDGAPFAEY